MNKFLAIVLEAARILRSEWRQRDFTDQGGDGATFYTKAEKARLSRLGDQESIPRDQGGYGAIFQSKAETARARINSSRSESGRPRLRRIRRKFSDQGGDSAAKNQILVTMVETARLPRPRRRRCDFSDQGKDRLSGNFNQKKNN